MSNIIMSFRDAPKGARFRFIGDDVQDSIYVKMYDYDDGLIVKWNGNVIGHQSLCHWVDEENGYDLDTKILVLDLEEKNAK